MAEAKGVSLNPDDFTEGGGLLGQNESIRVTWKEPKFELRVYGDVKPPGVPIFCVGLTDLDTDEDYGNQESWSLGSAKDWKPSSDGKELIAVGSANSIRSSTKLAKLLESMVSNGFPKDKLTGNVALFDGLQCVMRRVAYKTDLVQKERPDGRKFDPTVLVVEEILSLPGEKKSGKGTSPKSSAKSNKKEEVSEVSDDTKLKVAQFVQELLEEAGEEGVPKKTLPTSAFKKFKGDNDQSEIVQLVNKEDFLKEMAEAGFFTFEGGIITEAK